MPSHVVQSAGASLVTSPTDAAVEVPAATVQRPKPLGRWSRMHPSRLVAGKLASRIVAQALGETSARGLGSALDVGHTCVLEWANADNPASMTLRDVIAAFSRGETAFARKVVEELRALFAEPDEAPEPPSRAACRISALAGTLCGIAYRIESDGVVDEREEAEFLEALRAASSVIEKARRAREVARGLMGKR